MEWIGVNWGADWGLKEIDDVKFQLGVRVWEWVGGSGWKGRAEGWGGSGGKKE